MSVSLAPAHFSNVIITSVLISQCCPQEKGQNRFFCPLDKEVFACFLTFGKASEKCDFTQAEASKVCADALNTDSAETYLEMAAQMWREGESSSDAEFTFGFKFLV